VATMPTGGDDADFGTPNRWEPVDAAQVERIAHGRRPTPAQAALMRQLARDGWSANRISARFWGYKDSDTLRFVREALH